jgi:hypothetical protein
MNVMSNLTGSGGVRNNDSGSHFLKKIFHQCRQLHLTAIATLQDPKGIATEIKANADCVWMFGGLPRSKIMKLFTQLPHIQDPEGNFESYSSLGRNDVMIFFFIGNTPVIRIVRSRFFNSSSQHRGVSVMIETEELTIP